MSSRTIECPDTGCQRYVTYHEVADHQSACLPLRGARHFNALHSVPVRIVQHGKVSQLQLPVSAPWLLLLRDDDNRVFVLTVGALGAGAAAVSMVCEGGGAAAIHVQDVVQPGAVSGGGGELRQGGHGPGGYAHEEQHVALARWSPWMSRLSAVKLSQHVSIYLCLQLN